MRVADVVATVAMCLRASSHKEEVREAMYRLDQRHVQAQEETPLTVAEGGERGASGGLVARLI